MSFINKFQKMFFSLLAVSTLLSCHHSSDSFHIHNRQEQTFYINKTTPLEPNQCLTLDHPPESIAITEGSAPSHDFICQPCNAHITAKGYYAIEPQFIGAIYKLGAGKFTLYSIPPGDTTCPQPEKNTIWDFLSSD